MLRIRHEQMAALLEAQRRQFALEMVEHLRRYSTVLAARIGDPGLYQVARNGLAQAERYGFTARGPVRLYIELTVMFGSHFDTDPQFPWAMALLNDRTSNDQMARAELVYQQAIGFYDSVLGPDYRHELAAIRRLREEHFGGLPDRPDAFRAEVLLRLRTLYPERAVYVGQAALELLLTHAARLAQQHSLGTMAGVALVMALVFAFGHRCDIDPAYPWIAQSLSRTKTIAPEQRVPQIRSDLFSFLRYGSVSPRGQAHLP
jgi:hypothetical protein